MKKMLKKCYHKIIPSQKKNLSPDLLSKLSHPITLPGGHSEQSLLDYLLSFQLDGQDHPELGNYLRQDFRRFVYTVNLLPGDKGSLLDVGSNPYYTALLIEKFFYYDCFYTNFFEKAYGEKGIQVMESKTAKDKVPFEFFNSNVEEEKPPYNQKFDVILLCEVIEHFQKDPIKALLHIKDSLKDGGHLILTTPNVCRLENIAKMLAGANIYDPYSGYGAYGRHNREYNRHELTLLLQHLGFEVEVSFTSDVHENNAASFYDVQKLQEFINFRSNDLGQYLFFRAKNVRPAKTCRPRWLFRSYPEDKMCQE